MGDKLEAAIFRNIKQVVARISSQTDAENNSDGTSLSILNIYIYIEQAVLVHNYI